MRKLSWLFIVTMLSGVTLAANFKPLMSEFKSNPVDKTLSFLLYKGSDYTSKAYRGTSAEVYISVEKVENTVRTLVWDTTFDAKQLNKCPSLTEPHTQSVAIQNVIESDQHLEINYCLTYEAKGSVLKMQSKNFDSRGIDSLVIKL